MRSVRRITEVEGMEGVALPLSLAAVSGELVFVSGQGPFEPGTMNVPGEFEDQARLTLRNVERVLKAAGAGLADVVKVNVYLSDLERFPLFNEVYREFFIKDLPARTTVGANLLGIQVEIEAVAVLDKTAEPFIPGRRS